MPQPIAELEEARNIRRRVLLALLDVLALCVLDGRFTLRCGVHVFLLNRLGELGPESSESQNWLSENDCQENWWTRREMNERTSATRWALAPPPERHA